MKKKKSLVGWVESGNFDNLENIYKDWKAIKTETILSKVKSVWHEPVKVRITIEEI